VYQWDAENRLVVISIYVANSGTTNRSEFTYDGFGRRVQAVEKNNGTVTSTKRFVWAGLELAQERAANNAVTKRFFGGGEQIGGTNCYFTRDHLGSVREMTDSSGTVRARYDYDPYGRQTKLVGDLDADFGFTGHYVHAPSGLYLTLFRAYNADSGRWLNRDPLGEAGGMNLYGYVGNNPIRHFDPLGLAMGDWWDARTWFNSGFTESWSDSANSIGQSMGGALAGNMNQVAGGYEKGVLGQTECGPTWAKWGTRGALGIGVVATAGIAVAALPAPGAVLYYDLIGNPITVGEFASAVVTTPIAVAAPYVSSAVQATALFYIQNQEFVPVTIALTEDVIGIEDPTPPAGGDFVGGLYYIISQSFQTISKSLNE
jgi:RHS repeat-associated protein